MIIQQNIELELEGLRGKWSFIQENFFLIKPLWLKIHSKRQHGKMLISLFHASFFLWKQGYHSEDQIFFFFFWQVERMQGNSQLMIFRVQFLILVYFKYSELMSTFFQNLIYIPCSRENCLILCFFFSSTPQSIFLKTQRRSQFYLHILLKMQILLESEIKLVWCGIQESPFLINMLKS